MAIRLKRHDTVKVIAGKQKGSEGKVLRVEESKVWVEGLNIAKKHSKPSRENEQGGIVEKEMPIHISNVMLVSPKSNKPVKVSRKELTANSSEWNKKLEIPSTHIAVGGLEEGLGSKMASLKEKYSTDIVPALKEQLELKNVMQVPKLEKIVINMGIGKATQNPRLIEEAVKTLTAISGQKAVATRAKKGDFEL